MTLTRTAALALFAALASPAAAQDSSAANPWWGEAVADVAYGIYCATEPVRQDPAPETASGVINIVDGLPEIVARQFVVPAEEGIGFGVLVQLADGIAYDNVAVTVTHPPFPGSGVEIERWTTSLDAEGYSLMGFTFETPEEEVPGEWTFSATIDGELLYHAEFQVVAPELAPNALGRCFGEFVS
ncbi:DUF3859 domain-containing protein [Rhodobacterales bacterium HKCCE2091]|nr:DUF3859 domain-containing protein [Rhodobacterales bacterium HKCCE2091]